MMDYDKRLLCAIKYNFITLQWDSQNSCAGFFLLLGLSPREETIIREKDINAMILA